LAKSGIRKWRAAEKPGLTEEHAQLRKEWAERYAGWTVDDWRKVVWSDECSVARAADPSKGWVFRTREERWHRDCIDPRAPSQDISLMIWGCIAGNVKGPMVPLVLPSVTGRLYLSTLQNLLPPFMDHLPEDPFNLIFMHDNAPIHKSRIVQNWLSNQDFITMEWPPYSPDLNPIEHVWRELKVILHRQHPDLKTLRAGKDRVKAHLVEVLPEAWDAISEEFLETLVTSMPRRVQAVLKADGWSTKY
jgi:hypothetical protein